MTTQQGLRQASVRAVTSTTETYNGDWEALFTLEGIADGDFDGRFLTWLNRRLPVVYDNITLAKQAFAVNLGLDAWSSVGTFTATTTFLLLLENGDFFELEDATGLIALE